jgi:hypothetical protein
MKAGPNYRMSSMTKMALATIIDPHKRGAWKRAMIEAELQASVQPRSSRGKQDKGSAT